MKESNQVFKTSAGVGKHKVDLTLTLIGHDVVAIISGGNKPHVGAVAVAIPRPSLKDASKISSTSSVFTLVGHKDDEVAKMASEALASKLNKVAVVSAGIHTDNASESDIRKLVKNAESATEHAIKIFLSQR
ncbi:MAG: hypothetical protein ABH852_04510 [Methanobacteriota archaeon]